MSKIDELAELAKRATQGDWKALNMVYENGEPMTPEQLGNYVRNAVLANPDIKNYLFISCTKADGDYDLCHIGNGPDGPYNAALIAACNPAAITQAHAEHAELERRNAELVDAVRFLAATWSAIDNFVRDYCKGDEIMHYPVIQGTSNQMRLIQIGEQPYNHENVGRAIVALAHSAQEK